MQSFKIVLLVEIACWFVEIIIVSIACLFFCYRLFYVAQLFMKIVIFYNCIVLFVGFGMVFMTMPDYLKALHIVMFVVSCVTGYFVFKNSEMAYFESLILGALFNDIK
jgi:hypothetical protein